MGRLTCCRSGGVGVGQGYRFHSLCKIYRLNTARLCGNVIKLQRFQVVALRSNNKMESVLYGYFRGGCGFEGRTAYPIWIIDLRCFIQNPDPQVCMFPQDTTYKHVAVCHLCLLYVFVGLAKWMWLILRVEKTRKNNIFKCISSLIPFRVTIQVFLGKLEEVAWGEGALDFSA